MTLNSLQVLEVSSLRLLAALDHGVPERVPTQSTAIPNDKEEVLGPSDGDVQPPEVL